jgi:hypothetical protein
MKIETAMLHKYAGMAATALEKRPTRSEYGGIRIRAEDGEVSLYGTDGEMFMIAKCPTREDGEPFDVIVDPRLVLALTATGAGLTELSMDRTKLDVITIQERASLPTEAADYYPAVERKECTTPFPLSRREVGALAVAAQAKSNLPRDSSIHLTCTDGIAVCATTTAGFRHACISFETDFEMNALIPLEPLISSLKAIGDDAQIFLGDDMVMVTGGMATARFPTNQGAVLRPGILSMEPEFSIDVPDPEEIASILSNVLLFSDAGRVSVLEYDGECVSIKSRGGIEYRAETTLRPHTEEPFSTHYRAEYLLGALIASGSELQMSMVNIGKQYPYMCKVARSETEFHMVVPVVERTT